MSEQNPYLKSGKSSSGKEGKGQRVVCAMSGGVDSAVAAAILKQQGYEVIGMALQVTDYSKYREADSESSGNCCSIKDMDDARRVADALKIPFYVLDTEKTFDSNVVNYFINDYLEGRTPNPCVMCNTKVKFNHLYRKALDLGCDFIATGHYAKITKEPELGYCLWRSEDDKKDQTYFLFNLTQSQLERTLFPVGNLTKDKVRKIADELKLPVATKPESMEICFVPGNDYSRFIKSRVAPNFRPLGYFVDMKGRILGEHEGLYKYTIGQRKGLQNAVENARRLGYQLPEPAYVVKLDPVHSHVVIGSDEDLFHTGLIASKVNWISPPNLMKDRVLKAKIRYAAAMVTCSVEIVGGSKCIVRFAEKQRAITPGQAVVFYDGNMCLGGGWIEDVILAEKDKIPKATSSDYKVLSVS